MLTTCFAQTSNERLLFVIDSIPLINNPEDWNPILNDDIADVYVLRNKDSLKLLGWGQQDGIMYIFTKTYRLRPDSIKKIPSLKQMQLKEDIWYYKNAPYSGAYIDYYNNGHIQNKGILDSGKLNGPITVYFKNELIATISSFKNGRLDGFVQKFYKNGTIMENNEYASGKQIGNKRYFYNGQLLNEVKFKKITPYDTILTFYSTGKIRKLKLIKNGTIIRDKKEEDIGYYYTYFLQNQNAKNVKEMNRDFKHLWLLDSINIDTQDLRAGVLINQSHFDEAIVACDKVLAIEPIDRSALLQRAIARIKKFQIFRLGLALNDKMDTPINLKDFQFMPEKEKQIVCDDLILADKIDWNVNYNNKVVPKEIVNYCISIKQ